MTTVTITYEVTGVEDVAKVDVLRDHVEAFIKRAIEAHDTLGQTEGNLHFWRQYNMWYHYTHPPGDSLGPFPYTVEETSWSRSS